MKRLHALLLTVGLLLGMAASQPAIAAEQAGPAPSAATDALIETTAGIATQVATPFIVKFAQDHPWIATILVVIGALRFFMKPITALVHTYVQSTESKYDDELFVRVTQSKAFSWGGFLVDWLGSIKLPAKTAAVHKDDINPIVR